MTNRAFDLEKIGKNHERYFRDNSLDRYLALNFMFTLIEWRR